MRFKTRLLGYYAALCVIVAGSVAVLYYHYNKQMYMDSEYQMLQNSSEQFANEFNLVQENMRFATNYVIGETELLDSLNLLVKNQSNANCPRYYKQGALLTIKRILSRDFLTKNFYSVRIFTKGGMMFTHDGVLDTVADHEGLAKTVLDYYESHKTSSSTVLVGQHPDDWNSRKTVPVISMVREILGYGGCCIEVQYTLEGLEHRLESGGDIQGLLIIASDGEILYRSADLSDETVECLREVRKEKDLDQTGMGKLAAVCRSDMSKAAVITVGDPVKQKEKLEQIRHMAELIAVFIACLLFCYANISAEMLVRPVKKFQKIMEITEYEKMDQAVEFNSQIRELDDMARSYEMLLKRLQKSMIKNKKMDQLYMQAQFDSLQAKISPHFMANILNVISSRGLELGDQEICQISSRMVSILRYSTDTRRKDIRVSEELHYLLDYCYLMKSRYLDKFVYEIRIPQTVRGQIIPRLSLQQLVENSVKYGFQNRTGVMEIQMEGWIEGDVWYISIKDNGQGFDGKAIETFYARAEEMKQQILEKDGNIELTLGGMGLINLYLRMYLLYGKNMIFEIKSHALGAEVIIGGSLYTP